MSSASSPCCAAASTRCSTTRCCSFKNAYGRFHPMMELPEEIDAEFAPIREGLQLLRELHRQRNYRPIADTIHALLEATRAHAGFAFRKGGERVLANVYRLTDLARSFEVGRRRHLIPRLRRIPGKRIRRQRYQRSAGAGTGRRRRAIDDRPQGQGPGISRWSSWRISRRSSPDRRARTAPAMPNAACARSACCGARRGNCWMPPRPKPRPTKRKRCASPTWRRRARAICWWWRRSARRSARAAG